MSLLSIVSKALERLIHKQVYEFLSNKLNEEQHGFIHGKSACTQLTTFIHNIGKSLDRSKTNGHYFYGYFQKCLILYHITCYFLRLSKWVLMERCTAGFSHIYVTDSKGLF